MKVWFFIQFHISWQMLLVVFHANSSLSTTTKMQYQCSSNNCLYLSNVILSDRIMQERNFDDCFPLLQANKSQQKRGWKGRGIEKDLCKHSKRYWGTFCEISFDAISPGCRRTVCIMMRSDISFEKLLILVLSRHRKAYSRRGTFYCVTRTGSLLFCRLILAHSFLLPIRPWRAVNISSPCTV